LRCYKLWNIKNEHTQNSKWGKFHKSVGLDFAVIAKRFLVHEVLSQKVGERKKRKINIARENHNGLRQAVVNTNHAKKQTG